VEVFALDEEYPVCLVASDLLGEAGQGASFDGVDGAAGGYLDD